MEEKVKSLAPHEINEEQKAVLAKKPELSITMKELTEIVDNLVQISKNVCVYLQLIIILN
jgi:hypothetical protein